MLSSSHFSERVPTNSTKAWKSLQQIQQCVEWKSIQLRAWNLSMWFNGMCIYCGIFDIRQLGIKMYKRQTKSFKKLFWREITVSHQNEEAIKLNSPKGGKPFHKVEKYGYSDNHND